MTTTYQTIAARTATQVPAHLDAQASIPIVTTGGARQGDVYVIPTKATRPAGDGVTLDGEGWKVVRGDADRNSHILNDGGAGCRFYPGTVADRLLDYGLLDVPAGAVCYLTHTSEHGSIGIGAGTWRVFGQVEYAAELRRAAD